jgi:hypothetical protein
VAFGRRQALTLKYLLVQGAFAMARATACPSSITAMA